VARHRYRLTRSVPSAFRDPSAVGVSNADCCLFSVLLRLARARLAPARIHHPLAHWHHESVASHAHAQGTQQGRRSHWLTLHVLDSSTQRPEMSRKWKDGHSHLPLPFRTSRCHRVTSRLARATIPPSTSRLADTLACQEHKMHMPDTRILEIHSSAGVDQSARARLCSHTPVAQ